jgi:hypothetical protein
MPATTSIDLDLGPTVDQVYPHHMRRLLVRQKGVKDGPYVHLDSMQFRRPTNLVVYPTSSLR